MEGKENKPGILSCIIKGPGPVYKLPTLVGYNGHDPSRYRNPAYSIRARTDIKASVIGPGPHYNVRNLTKSGSDNPPAYTIRGRKAWIMPDHVPGPGAYSPELCPPMNHNRRVPAYSIKSRGVTKFLDEGPGPNSYLLPTCIGPKVPDKPAQSAFSIIGYRKIQKEILKSPGPATYIKINYDMIKRRSPAYSLKGRHFLSERYRSPALVFYPLYDTRKRSPMYSFGIKHSECAGVPMTQLDED
ncbi:ODF3A protein, partial [Acromyrmex insinuator]